MSEFPNQENVQLLLDEAVEQSEQLGKPYDSALKPDFVQAQETLESVPEVQSQLALILSAARLLITKVEKKTVGLIIGDDPITGRQMSHLVRIRLICAELINLLTSSLERVKQPDAPV